MFPLMQRVRNVRFSLASARFKHFRKTGLVGVRFPGRRQLKTLGLLQVLHSYRSQPAGFRFYNNFAIIRI